MRPNVVDSKLLREIGRVLGDFLSPCSTHSILKCEFKCDHDLTKRLVVPNGTTRIDDTEAKTVSPDIIVHHRNGKDNLLVIEVKKSSSSDNGDFDRKKLEAFGKPPFNYQYGLFLRLNVGSLDIADPELDWFPNPRNPMSEHLEFLKEMFEKFGLTHPRLMFGGLPSLSTSIFLTFPDRRLPFGLMGGCSCQPAGLVRA